jgi:hypothetical protein
MEKLEGESEADKAKEGYQTKYNRCRSRLEYAEKLRV